jgi:hypothetical protein
MYRPVQDRLFPSLAPPIMADKSLFNMYVHIQWGGPATVDDKFFKIIDLAAIYIQSNGIAIKGKGKVVPVLN